MIEQYCKVKLKTGKYAIIVEVCEQGVAYIADIEMAEGEYETETIYHTDILAKIIEIEQPMFN